jgi:hypothetical protein
MGTLLLEEINTDVVEGVSSGESGLCKREGNHFILLTPSSCG